MPGWTLRRNFRTKWEEWKRKNEEQFGADWPMAQVILGELEDLGIHMLDPSPSNLCFR